MGLREVIQSLTPGRGTGPGSRGREDRTARTIKKAVKKLTHRYGQSENRQKAVQTLTDIGTPEAIAGLLQRFDSRIESSILDEDEKSHICEIVVGLGDITKDPIKRHLINGVSVSWPLKALASLAGPEEVVGTILDTLDKIGAGYSRTPEKKVSLIEHLEGHDDPRILEALLPFLEDMDDSVILAAVAVLSSIADERAREPFLKLLVEAETSARVRAEVLEKLAKRGWTVRGFRPQVEEVLAENFYLDKAGHIRRRGS